MKNLFTDGFRTKKHLLKPEIFVHALQHLKLLLKHKDLNVFSPPVGLLVLILYTIVVVTEKYLKSTISEV